MTRLSLTLNFFTPVSFARFSLARFSLGIMAMILSLGVSLSAQAKEDPIFTGTFSSAAIKGYDTVAYFTEGKAVKGNKKITADWQGTTWRFSSEQNKALFVATPEKYAPQYGGYCAYAMSDGRAVGVDPKAYSIVNDKLYLNYSKSVRKHWNEDSALFIKQADEWFPKVIN